MEEHESPALSAATGSSVGTVPPHLEHSWHGPLTALLLKRSSPKAGVTLEGGTATAYNSKYIAFNQGP